MTLGRRQRTAQPGRGFLARRPAGEFSTQAAALEHDVEIVLQVQQQNHREHATSFA